MTGRRCMRCLCTTRIRERWRRITTRCGGVWRATIFHRGARAVFYRHHRLRRLCAAGDDVSGAHRRAGRVRALLRAAFQQAIEPPGEARSNVWLFGQLAQRMGFTEACFRDTPEEMIRQALAIGADGRSTNAGMEHITFEDLEREGHVPLAFHAEPGRGHFCRTLRDRWRRRRARSSFTRRRWRRQASIRFRDLFLRSSRAGASGRRNIRWSFGAQERQLHELDLCEFAGPPQDGGADKPEA